MSPDQSRRALSILAQGGSQSQAAQAAGISTRTLQRWMRTDEFRQAQARISLAVGERIEALSDEISEQLKALTPISLKVIQEVLEDSDARTSDRLKAASLVIEWWQKQKYSNHKDILLQHLLDSIKEILASGEEKSKQHCLSALDSSLLELGRNSVLEILSKN